MLLLFSDRDAQKIAELKQKRMDAARKALQLLRTTCIVWPNSASEVFLAGSFDGWTTQVRYFLSFWKLMGAHLIRNFVKALFCPVIIVVSLSFGLHLISMQTVIRSGKAIYWVALASQFCDWDLTHMLA